MFYEGQIIKNITNGITGEYVRSFTASYYGEIVVIHCNDGRYYRAPKNEWISI